MTDVFSKKKRSEIMSVIRSKGNRTTEWRIRSRLISARLFGWKVNDSGVFGKPDFVFRKEKIAIFVDGCFWHGCKRCRNIPSTNRKFWLTKIEKNQARDRLVNRTLKRDGWHVIRFWEHQVHKDPTICIRRIKMIVEK
ncbi:MAG: very short patch repair endonuclease [Anaerolineales bacterium]